MWMLKMFLIESFSTEDLALVLCVLLRLVRVPLHVKFVRATNVGELLLQYCSATRMRWVLEHEVSLRVAWVLFARQHHRW